MKTVFEIGNEVRTWEGSYNERRWVYGKITDIQEVDGYPFYRIDYCDGVGGHDWMYDCEIEFVREVAYY